MFNDRLSADSVVCQPDSILIPSLPSSTSTKVDAGVDLNEETTEGQSG